MATETKVNPLAGLIDTSEINDGSGIAPGAEEVIAVAITDSRGELKTALKASRQLTATLMAVAYNTMLFSKNVLNAAGYPIWSLATDKATETVLAIVEALYDEAFGIPENASDEVKKELRKERSDNLTKVRLNRTRVFVEAFITERVFDNTMFTDEQKADMAKPGYLKWNDARKDFPDLHLTLKQVPSFLKKPFAEEYKRSGLDVPEKFGGAPKDKNAQGTKDKKTSPDAFDKAAGETMEGFTQLRAAQSIVNLTKAYVRTGLAAETITDRDQISLELHELAAVATLYAKFVDGVIKEAERATLDSLIEIPDLVESIKQELAVKQ